MKYLAAGLFASVFLSAPIAFANAQSLSIQSVSPGTSVFADSKITFIIGASGFFPQSYRLTDSFSPSTVSSSDISGAGNFSWVPVESDVGTHVLSISASDDSGNTATVSETIMVEPAPSLSVSSVSPGDSIMPGTKLTFSVSAQGFTDPSYLASDSFPQSTVTDSDIDASGDFSWTPADISQDGQHVINIYAYDSLGHNASINVPIQVGPGPTLTIQSLSPGTTVPVSQPLSFTVNGSNFSPNSFAVSDTFPATTLANTDINTSGNFYWIPQASDVGTHVLTISGTVGVYGQSATTTETITVVGPSDAASPVSTSSVPAPGASLSQLQAELAQVQSEISGRSGAATSASLSSGIIFTTPLYSGMQGTAVTQLQTLLSKLGFFQATPNGYFGPLTVAAVEKFQAAHGLEQLGVVGPATRAALNSLLAAAQTTTSAAASSTASDGYVFNDAVSFGQSGTDVLELQKRLAELGFFSEQPTGYFGIATLEALMQFQNAQGIPLVDQLGAATRAALNL